MLFFFFLLVIYDDWTNKYISNIKYFCVDLPLKWAAQWLQLLLLCDNLWMSLWDLCWEMWKWADLCELCTSEMSDKLVYIYIFLKLAGPLVKLDEDSGAVYEMSTEKSQQYFNNWFIFSSFFGLNAKYLVPVFNINICYLCSLFMNLVLLCWFQSHSQQIHII